MALDEVLIVIEKLLSIDTRCHYIVVNFHMKNL